MKRCDTDCILYQQCEEKYTVVGACFGYTNKRGRPSDILPPTMPQYQLPIMETKLPVEQPSLRLSIATTIAVAIIISEGWNAFDPIIVDCFTLADALIAKSKEGNV